MGKLSLTQYAKHRGVWPRAVEAAIAAGRIQRGTDGLIDAEQADADWDANTSSVRSAASKENGQRGQAIRKALAGTTNQTSQPAVDRAALQSDREPTDMGAYAKARAQREHYQAELARLAFEQRAGTLLPREVVVAAAERFYSGLRVTLEAVADRLADELAATADPAQVRTILADEIASVLTRQGTVEASYGG